MPARFQIHLARSTVTDGQDKDGRYVVGGKRGDGESAVIILPGFITEVATISVSEGPAIYTYDQHGPRNDNGRLVQRIHPECFVHLEPGNDPDYVSEDILWGWGSDDPRKGGWPEAERNVYHAAIKGSKIGGTPCPVQTDDFPPANEWLFLLQLEQHSDECLPVGSGIGYLFLARDGTRSPFIVQTD